MLGCYSLVKQLIFQEDYQVKPFLIKKDLCDHHTSLCQSSYARNITVIAENGEFLLFHLNFWYPGCVYDLNLILQI